MKSHFSFEEETADGWRIQVKQEGVHVGNVIKNSNTGRYQYFLGPSNFHSLTLENENLDKLKKKIESQ